MIESITGFLAKFLDYSQESLNLYAYTFIRHLFKIVASFMLTIPLALEREYFSRSLGLRTFPLVAVASCGYVLVSDSFIPDNPDAKARIMQGLMTGIGFIGGGAILKQDDNVIGAATAVSLWSTGVVGAAVAHNRFEIAILIAFLNFLALRVLSPLKDGMEEVGLHEDQKTFSEESDKDGDEGEESSDKNDGGE
ncbi:MAG: MgtC/SapB family protein [Desulfococcaceae bacterium]